jgi:hypothetical protein
MHTPTTFLLGNLEDRYHLGEFRKWEDNIRMDLKETECKAVYWIYLVQNRLQR